MSRAAAESAAATAAAGAATTSETMSRRAWVAETRRLLAEEWAAENELAEDKLDVTSRRILARLGLTTPFLQVDAVRTGMYGRSVLTFVSCKGILATGAISVGDVVRVVPNEGPLAAAASKKDADAKGGGFAATIASGARPPSGIVAKVSEEAIEVAFDERNDDQQLRDLLDVRPLRLDRLPNDATNAKQLRALESLETIDPTHHAYHAAQVLFNEAKPMQHPRFPNGTEALSFFNQGLNEPQKEAIGFALRSRDIALIHGPPGTGKTTSVVELIRQAAQVMNLRVLVCAPSNVAVDNLVLRLAEVADSGAKRRKRERNLREISLVRLGHPARVMPEVLEHSLDAVVQRADATEVVEDIRQELRDVVGQMVTRHSTSNKKGKTTRKRPFKELRAEARELRKELRTRERAVVDTVIKRANVVLATNTGAASILKKTARGSPLDETAFDLVIIDEAAQAIEASCWIPILLGRRVVLAGDHKQLPPTIKSHTAAQGLLGTTLFDRVVDMYGDRVVRLLSIQYRMHQVINDWSSSEMYDSRLIADASVASRKLSDLEHIHLDSAEAEDDPLQATLVLVDTAFCGLEEGVEGDDEDDDDGPNEGSKSAAMIQAESSGSKYNRGEAEIVVKYVLKLFEHGLRQDEVAVITPYNAQVHLLRSLLHERYPLLEVRSVDGFQGREKEVVVLSLVRSNDKGVVGFLADDRRLNVAITRARRQVCLIADSETIAAEEDSFLGRVVDYFQAHALLQTAEDYLEECVPVVASASRASIAKAKAQETKKPREREVVAPDRVAEIHRMLRDFMADALKTVLELNFSPGERQVVHAFCEDHGLGHVSAGSGAARHIIVRKKSESQAQSALPESDKQSKMEAAALINDGNGDDNDNDDDNDDDHDDDEKDENNDDEEEEEVEETVKDDPESEVESDVEDDSADKSGSDENSESADTTSKPNGASGASASASAPRMNPAMEAFTKQFLPKKYQELVEGGMAPNEACIVALRETQRAFALLQKGGEPASTPAPAPAPAPAPPSVPKTPLEKVREMQAARYAQAKAAKEQEAQSRAAEQAHKRAVKKSGKKNKKTKGKSNKMSSRPDVKGVFEARGGAAEGEDEELAFLDSLVAANRKCAFRACDKSVVTMSSVCPYCKLSFCMSHGLAEAHGCGDMARAEARREHLQAAAKPVSSARPLRAHQRSALSRQLGEKIAGKSGKRVSTEATNAAEKAKGGRKKQAGSRRKK